MADVLGVMEVLPVFFLAKCSFRRLIPGGAINGYAEMKRNLIVYVLCPAVLKISKGHAGYRIFLC
jgi:hypothetical protein